MNDTARAAEHAARDSYGRLLSILASRSSDIASAEDALSDAFAKALMLWPKEGVPDNPDAWLVRVAKNRLIDGQRRSARLAPEEDIPEVIHQADSTAPDKRLELMFVCAHPAIDRKMHTPLMLQCVMGLEAEQIGQAFLVPKATMAQRLVRAKTKIKANAVPFKLPNEDAIDARLDAVMEAIYGAYSSDWLETGDAMGMEALYLADVLCTQLPTHAEAHGLAALLGFAAARRDTRIVDGVFVPLDEQNPAAWNTQLTRGAQALLRRASEMGQIGRFQLEAAIQAIHARRIDGEPADWRAATQLYAGLCQLYPTLGAQIGYAVALSHVQGADAGLAVLDALEPKQVLGLQSYHAARAHFLSELGQLNDAAKTYEAALALTAQPPLRAFLEKQRQAVIKRL
ncbi:RNA polymerase sigma factor [Planktotalea sp.]|uniref:RNA polymerase sigma factor n=1 Tax=Planktotalea sp. TaxID=2029877 RepID=UPI003D6C2A85